MKKKLLFVIPEYSHGGTNKSLENLLHFIDKSKYEVSIYSLYEDGGSLYKEIFAPYILKKSLLYTLAHDNKITRKIMGLAMKISSKVNFDWLYRKEANRLQKKYKFDTVIAFQEGTATEFVSYIQDKVNIVAWIHCDYLARWNDINHKSEAGIYDKIHRIVCVSKTSNDSMLSIYPQYRSKSVSIHNTIDSEEIRFKAGLNKVEFENDCFNILSVGRFTDVKQFHLIPEIADKVRKQTSKNFCWYIIGDGEKRITTMAKIKSQGLDSHVKCIGAVDNPYPYFKSADLYVCSSSSESFSYTIAESKILGTPVLCNDFPVSSEVVDDTVGWICNIEDMANKIADIINDKEGMYSTIKKTISTYNYDNDAILSELYELLERATIKQK